MSSPFGHIFRQHWAVYKPPLGDDPGEPLFLTPYVKKGDFATGEFRVWREQQRYLMHVIGVHFLTVTFEPYSFTPNLQIGSPIVM